jgi:SAM-dependent MidA family methyltransferase
MQKEIQRDGSISFARFMELALYAPGLGYYERQREIGRGGDYFTSVSTGSLFGELLAFQFAQWVERDKPPGKWQLVEAGAHQGLLAADILAWMQRRRPDLFARLEYWLIEPSPARRAWQEETLRAWLSNVKWAGQAAGVEAEPGLRIIFCNELLDALPVHRFAWSAAAKTWEECRVGCETGAFVWRRAKAPADLVAGLPEVGPELGSVLQDGYVIEYSPAAAAWWKHAAESLRHGILLTIDYGLTAEELFRPERSGGTLRTYSRHHAGGGLLDHPGECDITGHVNFSAIAAAGRAAGLVTEGLMRQDQFLAQILAQIEANPGGFDPWTAARTRQFQTLTHPEHLGHAFQALVQMR